MYIVYSRDMDIRNLAALSAGTGCRWLLCIQGEGNELIAKKWCRKKPTPSGIEVVVCF